MTSSFSGSRSGQWHAHAQNAKGVHLLQQPLADKFTKRERRRQRRARVLQEAEGSEAGGGGGDAVVPLPSILERIMPRAPTPEKQDGTPREAEPTLGPEEEEPPAPPQDKSSFRVFRRHRVPDKPEQPEG